MGFAAPFTIIGHRGAAGLEPENTLRSFRRAFELGVHAVELDVYAVEGRLVVIHDDRLERTTNGAGLVAATPLPLLRTLDAGSGERIPLLEDVFAAVPDGVGVNVELKGPGTAGALVPLLRTFPHVEVLVSSFKHRELREFRALDASTRVAVLYQRTDPAMLETARELDAFAINLSNELATPQRVAEVTGAGYRCFVYTVNDPVRAKALAAMGASGVFTDRPDRVSATAIS